MKKYMFIVAATLIFLLGVSNVGSATIWYVDSIHGLDPGFPVPGGWGDSWDEPFKTINQALERALTCDEIWVREGSYEVSGGPLLVEEAVRIYGGFPPRHVNANPDMADRNWDVYETTIEPEYRHNAPEHLMVISADAVIEGFNFVNGYTLGDGGAILNNGIKLTGGILVPTRIYPTIRNCTFNKNEAFGAGGAIHNNNAEPNIIACYFRNNRADWGGAISNVNSKPSILDCDFVGNSGWFEGGAIYEDDKSIIYCEDSYFLENEAHIGDGGAIYERGTSSVPDGGEYINCQFYGNRADNDGGAIFSYGTRGTSMTSCKFVMNSSLSENGGAIFLSHGSDFLAESCLFSGNYSEEGGGAITMFNSYDSAITECNFTRNSAPYSIGGAIEIALEVLVRIKISNCYFESNEAEDGGAIGISLTNDYFNDPTVDVEDCTFENNKAENGGAIYTRNAVSFLDSCTFTNNDADSGGAIYSTQNTLYSGIPYLNLLNSIFFQNSALLDGGALHLKRTDAFIAHSTFTGNRSGLTGGAIYNEDNPSPSGAGFKIINSILWGNLTPPQYSAYKEIKFVPPGLPPYVYNSDIDQGWSWGGNNISLDPLFVNPLGNFHLRIDSPCRDAALDYETQDPWTGYNIRISPVFGIAEDFEDDPRIVGLYPDMGADEVLQKVEIDIMPGTCPNRPTVGDGTTLPVAILGTNSFSVNSINRASIKLRYMDQAISPSSGGVVRRVSRPVRNQQEVCDCPSGSDRINDLLLEFDVTEVIELLDAVTDEDQLVLTISGELDNGTPFTGKDCLDISDITP